MRGKWRTIRLGAGKVAADVAEHLHDVVDARGAADMRGARGGKPQHVLELGRAARAGGAVGVRHRHLAGDGDGAVAAQRDDAHAARLECRCRGLDTCHGQQQMLEPHLGRTIGERDIEGLVGAGEQRFVDPDGTCPRWRRTRGEAPVARGCVSPRRQLEGSVDAALQRAVRKSRS